MKVVRPRVLACLIAAASFATVSAGQVAPSRTDSPVLSPEAEMKTFSMPPGYRVELVASEPLIQDPVLVDWDLEGRLWAIEMPGYMVDIAAQNEHAPTGRIVVLEDTNDDGAMDKRTVFADGLVLPRALKVLDAGVLVGEPPNLWLMRDTNGDLKSDTRTLVTDRYGRRESSVEHNANSLMWALDNWMYTSEVDMFLRLKAGRFEVRRTLSRGQWGATQDDVGRVFRNTNESALHVDLVPTQYFARHPSLVRTRGSYESLEGPGGELDIVWPARATPGVNRGYQIGVLRSDGRLSNFTSVSSPLVYRGDRLPSDTYGNVFLAEPAANLVSRIVVADTGKSLVGRKAYEGSEFVASTDERFRPVYLSSAPDGTLYVVDMYRGIIQHKGYITEYLRDQILARNLEQPIARGRIYRVVHDTTRRGPKPSLTKTTPAALVDLLSHPNGWWRDTAQRLLVERADRLVVPALRALAGSAREPRTRLQALWTLDGLDSITEASVVRALGDPSRDVRVSAVRLSERWMGQNNVSLLALLRRLVGDPEIAVVRQLAASFGELPAGAREQPLADVIRRRGDDPVVLDAALSGLRGSEVAVLDALLQSNAATPALEAAATMIAATIVRAAQDGAIQNVFSRITMPATPAWQQSALLAGAEVALLNAATPGSPGRRGGATPLTCATCPGARQGPGGKPAFAQPQPAQQQDAEGATTGRAGGVGRAAGPGLRLSREPSLVSAAERAADPIGARASAVLAKIEWPGKPGSKPVVPLTPDEERRFAVGRDVYQNVCLPCHQADGRGMDRAAPALVGSEIALGQPAIVSRVLLNGKEGTIGLMPPLGASLTDEQIAGVLTYVRREWGQTESPIDPATVRDVRAATAARTRPWTNEELAALRPAPQAPRPTP